MRILWIRRRPADEAAGDSVYDGKLIRALIAKGHEVVDYGLARNTRARQVLRAALNFSLPEQYAVGERADVGRVRRMLYDERFDAVVFSHEHLDAFARAVKSASLAPFFSLRHNITSDLMSELLADAKPFGQAYRALAAHQERGALGGLLYEGVGAVSVRDRRLLHAIAGRQDIALVRPGAPPASPLNANATLARELVVSGTYDWFPKARDVRRFAREYALAPLQNVRVRCGAGVPETMRLALGAEGDDFDAADAIRFGVITDRFSAGHKLKTAAYLMSNSAVLSFANVLGDFADLPFARNWIVEVDSVRALGEAIDRIAARPIEDLRRELTALKAAVASEFAWSKQADVLEGAIAAAVQARRTAA